MSFSSPDSLAKEHLIQELLLEVEKRYALQPSPMLVTKISTVFEKLPAEALREWIGLLKNLPSEHPEWQSFVENLTIHETYFCRDRHMFSGIQKFIFPRLFEKNQHRKEINIWSAACSTGEEAYNLGMIAVEALQTYISKKEGVATDQFINSHGWKINILATDLSKQVLRIAEAAVYNNSIMGSLRNAYEEILPYFLINKTEIDLSGSLITSYEVKPSIKKMVHFKQFNLLSSMPPIRNVDLVVCRNVLIYFNDANKQKIQQLLDAALSVEGALVLGTVDNFYLKDYTKHLKEGCLWYEKLNLPARNKSDIINHHLSSSAKPIHKNSQGSNKES